MAEKTLNARFQLKYDKLADWQKTDTPNQGANLVLKKGEIAFCEIPTNGGKVGQETPPAVMFKVGDGEKTFAQLPWGTGLAGDVYDWFELSHEKHYYTNSSEILEEVMSAFDDKVDFSKYDSDGDGYIDGIWMVYSCPQEYNSDQDNFWAYTYSNIKTCSFCLLS